LQQSDRGRAETSELGALIAPGNVLRELEGGVLSAVAPGERTAPYDRRAATYDRLIGSRIYNRLIWGTSSEDYSAFAQEAVCAGAGPFLDAGCGTAVFTAAAYGRTSRPLLLVDRSLAMLRRAANRLAEASTTLIQADLEALPFSPASFETVACFAVLHVLDDPWKALATLREQMAPGGRLFASMLVSDRGGASRPYLSALRRRGEVGPLRRAEDLDRAARDIFSESVDVTRTGSMAWLRVGR
jgi:SAM-dependent methyltransferase